MPDQHQINDLHSRVTDLAAETAKRDSEIEKRHERLQAQFEIQTENVGKIEKATSDNAAAVAKLTGMHEEQLRENEYLCKTVKDAVDIADDARIQVGPVVEEHKQRIIRKAKRRDLGYKIFAGVAVVGLAGAAAWIIKIIWEALRAV